MEQTTLSEQLQLWNERASVDAGGRLVRNVALAGSASRNGYEYTTEALRDAARLYDEKPVFLDHGADRSRPRDRSTRDLAGSIVNPRFEDGRIRGDIRLMSTEAGDTLLKLVESGTPGVGMSHVVLAERGRDGRQVDRIVDVISVDVVVNPATTSTFQESCEDQTTALAGDDFELSRATIEHLQRELSAAGQRERALSLLLESGFRAEQITTCFREQVLRAGNEQACRDLIADRRLLLASSARFERGPRSLDRAPQGPAAADAEFVSLLKRR